MSSFYQTQDESLGRTGQFQSNLADVFYNAFGFNTAQQNNNFNAHQAALTRDFNSAEAVKARDFNSAEAQKQRDFEERMSNTSWQRAVSDMQAAGLNSALAYSQGGASVPVGSSASGSTASGGSAASSSSSGNPFQLIGAVINAVSGVAKAAISANSASSVAKVHAASAKEVANTYVNGREVNRIANILSKYDH